MQEKLFFLHFCFIATLILPQMSIAQEKPSATVEKKTETKSNQIEKPSVTEKKSKTTEVKKTTEDPCVCCNLCKNATDTRINTMLYVEDILIEGCGIKNKNLILDTITIKKKDLISPDDPKLLSSRLRLISLGLFEKIDLSFRKGSKKNHIQLVISIKIRGTFIIRHIFMGSSRIVPLWLGISAEERNFLGLGVTIGGSAVGSLKAEIMNGRPQTGTEAYVFLPRFFKIPMLIGGKFNYGSEFYRIYGDNDDGNPNNFLSIPYIKAGLKFETFFPLSSFYLRATLKSDHLNTTIPTETIRHIEDGTTGKVSFHLKDGHSQISVFTLRLIHDTLDSPQLPSRGHFISLSASVGAPVIFSSYTFTRGEALFEKYLKFGNHVFSGHFFTGGIAGNAPLFERFYIGDFQDLVSPRALEMNMSVATSPNFLGNNINETRWGTAVFKAWIRWDYPFLGRHGFIYKGNFFISAGAMGLFTASQLKYRQKGIYESLPVDLTFDFGLHLDTRYGMFKLSISNAIGRLPF